MAQPVRLAHLDGVVHGGGAEHAAVTAGGEPLDERVDPVGVRDVVASAPGVGGVEAIADARRVDPRGPDRLVDGGELLDRRVPGRRDDAVEVGRGEPGVGERGA